MRQIALSLATLLFVTSVGASGPRPRPMSDTVSRSTPDIQRGLIEINAPTVIVQPGVYTLTDDIHQDLGPVIVIDASFVTLDLSQQTVSAATGNSGPVIEVRGGTSEIVIRNGNISGGEYGVTSKAATLTLESLNFSHTVEQAVMATDAELVNLTGSTIFENCDSCASDAAVTIASQSARITDNTITRTNRGGIHVTGLQNGEISRNHISAWGVSSGSSCGISLFNTLSVNVADNTLSMESSAGICVAGIGNRITGNTIGDPNDGHPEGGIIIDGNGNVVSDNIINDAGDYADQPWSLLITGSQNRITSNTISDGEGAGLLIGNGARNLIENNLIQGGMASPNPVSLNCGIQFGFGIPGTAQVHGNIYRNNVLNGNPGGGVCGQVEPNIDGGGNIIQPPPCVAGPDVASCAGN